MPRSSHNPAPRPALCGLWRAQSLPTSYFLLPASYFLLLTSYFLLLTSYFLLPTSYFLLLTSYTRGYYFLLPASYFLLLTSYFLHTWLLLPASCFLLLLPAPRFILPASFLLPTSYLLPPASYSPLTILRFRHLWPPAERLAAAGLSSYSTRGEALVGFHPLWKLRWTPPRGVPKVRCSKYTFRYSYSYMLRYGRVGYRYRRRAVRYGAVRWGRVPIVSIAPHSAKYGNRQL